MWCLHVILILFFQTHFVLPFTEAMFTSLTRTTLETGKCQIGADKETQKYIQT